MKTALVCGAGGFIGNHLVARLKRESYFVIGVDLKSPEFSNTQADSFLIKDLGCVSSVEHIFDSYRIDEVYQLAADMGGTGYISTGRHDADILCNSALININVAKKAAQLHIKKVFFSSSSCVYSKYNLNHSDYSENNIYPAQPDNEYGWEKLFSERLYLAHKRNYGLDVRIARFYNIFGPEDSWDNEREKVVIAICRKVAEAKSGGVIDIWGNGEQIRSFLYIDECITGVRLLMNDEQSFEPLNIGSEEMITINRLAKMIIGISGKKLTLNYIEGPLGIPKSGSDNRLLYKRLNWKPNYSLLKGLKQVYPWVYNQISNA